MHTTHDLERMVEFEFLRATENAALHSMHWMGRGDKEAGMFDLVDIRGEVVIGEGIKDNAPGIFLGDRLGRWGEGDPRFDIALDPIDGTSNISKGMPNSISVMAAVLVPDDRERSMVSIPSFYVEKLCYGPRVARAIRAGRIPEITLDTPFVRTLELAAEALGKRTGVGAMVCPGITIETGSGRLLSRWMVSVVSFGKTVSAGPGTVTVPSIAPNAESFAKPHITTLLPLGSVTVAVPVRRKYSAAFRLVVCAVSVTSIPASILFAVLVLISVPP